MAKKKKESLFFDKRMGKVFKGLFAPAEKALKSKKFTRGY